MRVKPKTTNWSLKTKNWEKTRKTRRKGRKNEEEYEEREKNNKLPTDRQTPASVLTLLG